MKKGYFLRRTDLRLAGFLAAALRFAGFFAAFFLAGLRLAGFLAAALRFAGFFAAGLRLAGFLAAAFLLAGLRFFAGILGVTSSLFEVVCVRECDMTMVHTKSCATQLFFTRQASV